jgi:CspA family cold shock protein
MMSEGRPTLDKGEKRGLVPGPAAGTVKSFNPRRPPFGGFITEASTGIDVFVHKSAVEQANLPKLDAGQRVEFEVVDDGVGGLKAVRLRLVV